MTAGISREEDADVVGTGSWSLKAAAVALAAVATIAMSACEDEKKPTETINASSKPERYCYGVAQRRAIGEEPPGLPFQLKNVDVDNFNGASEDECNNRQLVYFAPKPPLETIDRQTFYVRAQFLRTNIDLEELSPPSRDRIRLPNGTPAFIYAEPGEVVGRFARDSAIFDATLACVPEDQRLDTVACRRPTVSAPQLRSALIRLITAFERQLPGGGP